MIWAAPQQAFAQQPLIRAPKTDHLHMTVGKLGLEEGLSQGMVYAMEIDKEGYLWVATKDGLNRYDGDRIKVFHHLPDDTTSIRENFVEYVLVDSKNRIWTSTQDGKVDMFDRKTETFIHVPSLPAIETKHPVYFTGGLLEDNMGNILVGDGSRGRYELIHTRDDKYPYTPGSFEVKDMLDIYPSARYIAKYFPLQSSMSFTKNGSFLFNTKDSIYVFTPDILASGARPVAIQYKPPDDGNFHGIADINSIGQEQVYIYQGNGLIARFDFATKKPIPFFQVQQGIDYIAPSIDLNNRLWLSQRDSNIVRIELVSGNIDFIELDWRNARQIARVVRGVIREDNNGNIWVGYNGDCMIRITVRTAAFRQMSGHLFPRGFFCASVAGDRHLIDTGIAAKPERFRHVPGVFSNYAELVFDNQHCFWTIRATDVGKKLNLVRIDPLKYTYDIIDSGADINMFGQPIFLDARDDVWYGAKTAGFGAQLRHFNKSTGHVEIFTFPVKVKKNEYRFISDWCEQPTGILWLATTEGVFSFDTRTKHFQHYANKIGDIHSLSSDVTLSLCPDPIATQRYLWVGTEGGGINKMDMATGKCTRYTTADGLPNNAVYGIIADHHKNLWISTNKGLCLFNTTTLVARNFTTHDGLPYDEFNRYRFAHDHAGNLYFETMRGAIFFDPEYFYRKFPPSPVVINKLAINNVEIEYSLSATGPDKIYKLTSPVEQCRKLVLKHSDRILTLGFTVLDLSYPGGYHYKYMLDGFNKDWVDAGTRGEATFTNLDPGTYTFKVLGRNSNNIWSAKPAELTIVITPAWWGTWWFRLLVMTTVAGIVYLLYRYRVSQILKVERLRNSIALNLHDDIGSALSSNALYAEVLKKKTRGLSDESQNLLDKMISNTSEIMENMNDIVWATKEDMNSFDTVISRMRNFAVDITEAKGVKLLFREDTRAQHLKLKMQERKNIYMFYKEAVNNAIKHSGCDTLDIAIGYADSVLDIIVRDNGTGFESQQKEKYNDSGGNGLTSMQFRADQLGARLAIDSLPGVGTTVRVSIPV